MTTLSSQDLDELLKFSVPLAKEAGALILEGSKAIRMQLGSAASSADTKSNSVDLVTEWDVKVEELIKSRIKGKYPGFGFIGEESCAKGSRPSLTDEPTFCVDPLDGTTNFVHGFPFVCVSIGLIYQKQSVMGVIFNPFLNQLYSALKGQGAWLNEETRLPAFPPQSLASLAQAMIGVDWGYSRGADPMGKKSRSFVRLSGDPKNGVPGGKMAHALRTIGSSALSYCEVASGSWDVFWQIGPHPWDVCAGLLIAQEAGCFVAGGKSSPQDGVITEQLLLGRKHVVVRAIASTPNESSVDIQRRIVGEVYDAVEEWDPTKSKAEPQRWFWTSPGLGAILWSFGGFNWFWAAEK